uniref:Uncharacterized protein n=1 Tax=Opuntia streptacantha TaxID=393608 RepID=A0A7C9DD80_OPUST
MSDSEKIQNHLLMAHQHSHKKGSHPSTPSNVGQLSISLHHHLGNFNNPGSCCKAERCVARTVAQLQVTVAHFVHHVSHQVYLFCCCRDVECPVVSLCDGCV